MRHLIVHMYTGYCGSDGYDILVVPEGADDQYIDAEAYQMAVQNAENYGYEVGADYHEEGEDYSADMIEYDWEDYSPDKHDQHRSGGGSFADEFKRY